MITKEHRPNINEPIILFGMQFFDLAIVTGLFALLMIGGGMLSAFVNFLGGWFFSLIAFTYVGCVILLRFSNKQGEDGFLKSFISFHFYQPKHIRHYGKGTGRSKGA
jgi:hypothetical protein